MDDDNPNEVTAGAIVTVTVVLIRKNMSTLFGDEQAKVSTEITENGTDEVKEIAGDTASENIVKRPAWLKQKKGKIITNRSLNIFFLILMNLRW